MPAQLAWEVGETLKPSLGQKEILGHIAEWVRRGREPRLQYISKLFANLGLDDNCAQAIQALVL